MCTAIKRARSPHQPTGTWIRPASRLAIYLRDGFQCLVCLRNLHDADPRDVTLDHVRPQAAGGSNLPGNLFTSCRSCNCSRQDRPVPAAARPRVRKHTRRAMTRYRKLAHDLLKAG